MRRSLCICFGVSIFEITLADLREKSVIPVRLTFCAPSSAPREYSACERVLSFAWVHGILTRPWHAAHAPPSRRKKLPRPARRVELPTMRRRDTDSRKEARLDCKHASLRLKARVCINCLDLAPSVGFYVGLGADTQAAKVGVE